MSWFESLFGFAEETGDAAAWARTRARFHLAADGTLSCGGGGGGGGRAFRSGRFSSPTLGEARASARAQLPQLLRARARPSLTFAHAVVDDVLAAHARAPAASLFLAASGLNCLELAHPAQTPADGVVGYAHDATQGPACALAAAPAAVARNYFHCVAPVPAAAAPGAGGGPLVLQQLDCLDELAVALGSGDAARAPFVVRNGYVSAPRGAAGLAEANVALAGEASRAALRARVRVGVQADTEVVFASRWVRAAAPARRVTQVFASALSLGSYKEPPEVSDADWAPLATLVLEAAYEATLWAGVTALAETHAAAASGGEAPPSCATVFLCGLGLGVFGNKRAWVVEAASRAVVALRREGAPLDVVWLHHRHVDRSLATALDDALARHDAELAAA